MIFMWHNNSAAAYQNYNRTLKVLLKHLILSDILPLEEKYSPQVRIFLTCM